MPTLDDYKRQFDNEMQQMFGSATPQEQIEMHKKEIESLKRVIRDHGWKKNSLGLLVRDVVDNPHITTITITKKETQ